MTTWAKSWASGVTHYPPLNGLDQNMARILRAVLQDPGLPAALSRPRQLAGRDAP